MTASGCALLVALFTGVAAVMTHCYLANRTFRMPVAASLGAMAGLAGIVGLCQVSAHHGKAKRQIGELVGHHQQAGRLLTESRSQHDATSGQLGTAQGRVEHLQRVEQGLRGDLSAAATRERSLGEQLAAARELTRTTQASLEAASAKEQSHHGQLVAAEQLRLQQADTHARSMGVLRQALAAASTRATEERTVLEAERAQLRTQVGQLEQQAAGQAAQQQTLTAQNGQLTGQVQQLTTQLRLLENVRRDLDAERQAHTACHTRAKEELRALEEQYKSAVTKDLNTLLGQLEASRERQQQLTRQNNSLEARLSEATASSQENTTIIASLRQDAGTLNRRIQTLAQQLATSETRTREAETALRAVGQPRLTMAAIRAAGPQLGPTILRIMHPESALPSQPRIEINAG
jgi:chromosome segregation ATPase